MLLASVTDIRNDLGFDDMTDITEAIKGALHAAEPLLAARLGTEFRLGNFVDTFFIREPGYTTAQHVETEFRLRRGFVQSISQVYMVSDVASLEIPSSRIDLLSAMTFVDMEKGILSDYKTRYMRQFIRVHYAAGFMPAPLDPESYDLDEIPYWLQQAAKAQALIHLKDNPALTEAGIKMDANVLISQRDALLGSRVRYTPMAHLPV